MNAQFSVQMDRRMAERVGRRCFLRASRAAFVIAVAFAAWFAVLAWRNWIDGALSIRILAAYLLVMAGYFLLCYLRAMRRARSEVRKWGEREIVYRVTDEGLHVRTPEGSHLAPWRVFERVLQYKTLWLLFTDSVNCYVLPRDRVSGDVGAFLVRKVREAGGKVK